MSLVVDEMQRHLKGAKRVVSVWEKRGVPTGRVEDNLRMISEEVLLLQDMAAAHPTRARALKKLADRYRAVRMRLLC